MKPVHEPQTYQVSPDNQHKLPSLSSLSNPRGSLLINQNTGSAVVSPVLHAGEKSHQGEDIRNLSAGLKAQQSDKIVANQCDSSKSVKRSKRIMTIDYFQGLAVEGSKYKKPLAASERKRSELIDSHEPVVQLNPITPPTNISAKSLTQKQAKEGTFTTVSQALTDGQLKSIATKVRSRLNSRNVVDSKTVINHASCNLNKPDGSKVLKAVFEFAKELKMKREDSQAVKYQ